MSEEQWGFGIIKKGVYQISVVGHISVNYLAKRIGSWHILIWKTRSVKVTATPCRMCFGCIVKAGGEVTQCGANACRQHIERVKSLLQISLHLLRYKIDISKSNYGIFSLFVCHALKRSRRMF